MKKLDANYPLTLAELFQAYYDCRRRKRNSHNALAFEVNLERNMCELFADLDHGTYTIGASIVFAVSKPKIREIWAADFRDRIVHHLIYNRIQAYINSRLIHQTYACIKGRGGLAAVDKLESYVRSLSQDFTQPCYFIKLDIQSFFMSINKSLLKDKLAPFLEVGWFLNLVNKIIDHSPQLNYTRRGNLALLDSVPRHKSLFYVGADTGIPIGNLSSQFFANVYLDEFDRYIKHDLRQQQYVRYVDDFIILSQSAEPLRALIGPIEAKLATCQLNIHRTKITLSGVESSIDFLGFKLCGRFKVPGHRVVENYKQSDKTAQGTNSSFAFMSKGKSFNVRKRLSQLTSFRFDPEFLLATA